jgi:hypothetical protein
VTTGSPFHALGDEARVRMLLLAERGPGDNGEPVVTRVGLTLAAGLRVAEVLGLRLVAAAGGPGPKAHRRKKGGDA